jgi:hypothetical protein
VQRSYYETDVIEVLNIDETLTVEKSITVSSDALVNLSMYVPTAAAGARIYRSTVAGDEHLLADVPFSEYFRNRPYISFPYTFIDEGNLFIGPESYPTSTTLSSLEQKAVPVPDFSLEEEVGGAGLAAGTYFYRVSFYTKKELALPFVEEDVAIKVYKPDLSRALVFTIDDLSSNTDFDLVSDIFAYAESVIDDVFFSSIEVGGNRQYAQELKWVTTIVKKAVIPREPVSLFTENSSVVQGVPVNIFISPLGVEIEVQEVINGQPETFTGVMSKTFTDPGTVSYVLTNRAGLHYLFSSSGFKVLS